VLKANYTITKIIYGIIQHSRDDISAVTTAGEQQLLIYSNLFDIPFLYFG